jgi:hypothetical protein
MDFPITSETPVEFSIEHEGNTYKVTHIFQAADTLEWLAYDRELSKCIAASQEEDKDFDAALMLLKIRCEFWKNHVKDVKGYAIEKGVDWKALIPVQHQLQAVSILEQKKRGRIIPPSPKPSQG